MGNSGSKNYYEILHITVSADENTIKAAYRRLARKFHPDVAGNSAEAVQKFKDINEAYDILSAPEKKKNYDTLRGLYNYGEKDETQKAQAQAQANKAYNNTKQTHEAQNSRKKNMFEDILNNIKKHSNNEPPKKGADVNSDISITIEEAKKGTERTINILHTEICPNCKGRKFVNGAKCPLCNGIGEQSEHKKITVKIPPSIKNGAKIRIANEGNMGYNGGKNGDLYLTVKVEGHQIFTFDGINVLCSVPVAPYEAALGETITVPTLDGGVANMKIMPGTENGQKYRLANQGLKKDGKTGDMIITAIIEIPKELTAKEKELYEELKKEAKHNVREKILNGN